MKEIQEHKIKIYEFPDTEEDEDSKLIRKIKVEIRSLHIQEYQCISHIQYTHVLYG